MSKRAELDDYTVRWFMRRIRARERAHKADANLCAQLRDKVGEARAGDTALSFGIFGDLIHHEARALEHKRRKPVKR